MCVGPRGTHDHDAERIHLEAPEHLAERERGLRSLAVGTADDQHAVHALGEHLAVDEAEERRPVEEHVVVLRLLDLLEEAVERVAREQLGRIGRRLAAGQHVQAAGARAGRAELEDAARAAVSRPHEDLGETGGLLHVEQLVELGPAHVGGYEPRPVHRLREDEPERRGDLGLALPAERARNEDGSLARRGQTPPKRSRKRLVRLVFHRAQCLGSMAHRAANVRNLGEHRQLQKPAQLPRSTDPWLELGTRQNDEGRDEDRGEESEGRISEWTRRVRLGRRPRRFGDRQLGARPGGAQVEIPDLRPDVGALGGRLLAPPALERRERLVERGASPVQAATLGASLRVHERGGDRVRDSRGSSRSLVRLRRC